MYRPEAHEMETCKNVCQVVINNPEFFPPDQFEGGLVHSVNTLLKHGEWWTKDQSISFDTILRKYNLGELSIPETGQTSYQQIVGLFSSVTPIAKPVP